MRENIVVCRRFKTGEAVQKVQNMYSMTQTMVFMSNGNIKENFDIRL